MGGGAVSPRSLQKALTAKTIQCARALSREALEELFRNTAQSCYRWVWHQAGDLVWCGSDVTLRDGGLGPGRDDIITRSMLQKYIRWFKWVLGIAAEFWVMGCSPAARSLQRGDARWLDQNQPRAELKVPGRVWVQEPTDSLMKREQVGRNWIARFVSQHIYRLIQLDKEKETKDVKITKVEAKPLECANDMIMCLKPNGIINWTNEELSEVKDFNTQKSKQPVER